MTSGVPPDGSGVRCVPLGFVMSTSPMFGVVRMRIGPLGASLSIGATCERSGRGVGFDGSELATSSSKRPVPTTSIGVGRGIFSAAATSAWPNSRAVYRSPAAGRPARSSTAARAPKSALTGSNLSARAANAAAAVSAANGVWPVMASTRTRASE